MVKSMTRKSACQLCHLDLSRADPWTIFAYTPCLHSICQTCWAGYWGGAISQADYHRCVVCFYKLPKQTPQDKAPAPSSTF